MALKIKLSRRKEPRKICAPWSAIKSPGVWTTSMPMHGQTVNPKHSGQYLTLCRAGDHQASSVPFAAFHDGHRPDVESRCHWFSLFE